MNKTEARAGIYEDGLKPVSVLVASDPGWCGCPTEARPFVMCQRRLQIISMGKWNSWRLGHHLKANEIRDSMKVLQRWLPLPFGPPTAPNGKHKAKGILGSVVRPTQVDTLQSTSLFLGSFSSSFSLSTFTLIFLVHIVRIFPRKCMWK